jgi:predicted transcriptional regulator
MKGVAKELKQEGKTQAKIAGMLGVSRQCVSEWFNRKKRNNDTGVNVSIDCRVKIDTKAKPLILERFEDGESVEEIAADLKVTLSEIARPQHDKFRPSRKHVAI